VRLYGLTRGELRYILDPQEVYGEDFPGETFRALKACGDTAQLDEKTNVGEVGCDGRMKAEMRPAARRRLASDTGKDEADDWDGKTSEAR
jgi:hypothetical protein